MGPFPQALGTTAGRGSAKKKKGGSTDHLAVVARGAMIKCVTYLPHCTEQSLNAARAGWEREKSPLETSAPAMYVRRVGVAPDVLPVHAERRRQLGYGEETTGACNALYTRVCMMRSSSWKNISHREGEFLVRYEG